MEKGRDSSRGASHRRYPRGIPRLSPTKKPKPHWLAFVLPFLVLLVLIQFAPVFFKNERSWLTKDYFFGPPFVNPSEERLAICLAGGARSFELTGLSIRERLLRAYPNSDVFLVVPLDADAHKLSLLAGVGNIVHAEVAPQALMREDDVSRELFDEYGSPNGVQGLLQYFALIESCQAAITARERALRFRYAWVLRTRPDGFWNGPPPPLATFARDTYYAPNGVDFDGVNDRLGLGSARVMAKMLARSSTRHELYAAGLRSANSEIALKAQLRLRGIPLSRLDFPFCVITRRTFPFVDRPEEVPVVPIGSAVTLNGVYCKPCAPMLTGQAAFDKMGGYRKSLRWFGAPRPGAEICNSTAEWERDWAAAFDARVGPRLAAARREFRNETFDACKRRVADLVREVAVWRGPFPREMCLVSFLGKPKRVKGVTMFMNLLRGPANVRSTGIVLGRHSPLGVALTNVSTVTAFTAMSTDRVCPVNKKCKYPSAAESAKLTQSLPRKVYIGVLEVAGLEFASRFLQEARSDPDLWVCQVVVTYHDTDADVKEWESLRRAYQEAGLWQVACEWTARNEARCLLYSDRRCNLKIL